MSKQRIILPDIRAKRTGNRYLLANYSSGRMFKVSPPVIDVLLMALAGKTEAYIKRHMKDYDVEYILSFLRKNGFFSDADMSRYKILGFVKKFRKQIVFISPFVLFVFLLLLFYGLKILAKDPLTSNDLFFVNGLGYVFLFFISWIPLTLIHEYGHFIVANLFGSKARIFFKVYFIFPALVTETPFVPFLSRWKRLMVHSAGIFVDVFLLFTFVVAAHFCGGVIAQLFRFFAMIKLLSIVSQGNLHLRTDLYFIIEDILNSVNLKADSFSFIKRLFGYHSKISNPIFSIILFLIVMVFGYSLNLFMLFYYILPAVTHSNPHFIENRVVLYSFLIIDAVFFTIKMLQKIKYLSDNDQV